MQDLSPDRNIVYAGIVYVITNLLTPFFGQHGIIITPQGQAWLVGGAMLIVAHASDIWDRRNK
jgi:hypothetical protein